MVRKAVEPMEDKISSHLLKKTNENQWNADASYPGGYDTPSERSDVKTGESYQERKGMDREKLESLVKKVHKQYGEALRRLAE